MAETLVTVAFLSSVAMILSILVSKGKWLSLITSLLCLTSFIAGDFDSIQQYGGQGLIVVSSMCITIQYFITKGINQNYLNGFGGLVSLILLLSMYPQSGLIDEVATYTQFENFVGLVTYLSIGFMIGNSLVNSYDSKDKKAAVNLAMFAVIMIFTNAFESSEIFVIVSSVMLLGILPVFDERIKTKLGNGEGRTNALAVSTLIGIILVYALTFTSISEVNRIGNGAGAVTVALWMTLSVTVIGLVGMLMPLIGFDAHPRPEAWGWRIGLAISPMILILQTDLAIYTLPSLVIAILISISSPLVLEKKRVKSA